MPRERQDHVQIESAAAASSPTVVSPNYTISEVVQRPQDQVGLHELTTPLWRGKGAIATCAILGLLVGMVASLLTTPSYRAHASLQLEGFSEDPLVRGMATVSPQLPNASVENYLQNEVKLLESQTLAKRVAGKLGIQPDDGRRSGIMALVAQMRDQVGFLRPWPKSAEEQRIDKVQKALTIRTSLQSQVIDLYYDAADPQVAASGANAAASEFIELNREARTQLVGDTTEWLEKQAKDLKAKLEVSNRQLQDFARANGLVFAGKNSTLGEDRIRQTQEALSRAQADRAGKQSRYEAVTASADSPVSDNLATGPLREYQVNLQNMRRELAQLRTQYTPAHYKVQSLMAQIAETEKAIETERKEIVARIHNEYVAGAGLERLLTEAQSKQLRTVQAQMEKERRYDVLKSEIDTTQKLYDTMLQKVEEAGVASALRTTNVRVIDTAKPPSAPYSPKTPLNLAIGFAIGTLGGIGLVVLRPRSLKVGQPGESHLNVPELGVIPSAGDARDVGRRGLIRPRHRGAEAGLMRCDDHDAPLWNESFRATLSSILFSGGLDRPPRNLAGRVRGRVLVISSIDVMEGKTTVLANLGIAAAERKQRVLLIDADLRRPRLHDLFNIPNGRGLTDVLQYSHSADFVDNSPLEALVRPSQIPDLWVLPRGPDHPNLASLLHSSDLSFLLQRFRREFDLILIDTPPMMLYSDARTLGRLSDGLLMVVRANTKSREELQAAHQRLVQDQIPVLGTILNDWKMDSGQARSYGRYQRHYQERPVQRA
jgi:polysaccharide biosynthesis transport protein